MSCQIEVRALGIIRLPLINTRARARAREQGLYLLQDNKNPKLRMSGTTWRAIHKRGIEKNEYFSNCHCGLLAHLWCSGLVKQ